MRIVITDDRFGQVEEERRIFKDAELIVADCRSEQDLAAACAGADGILLNQAPMTGRVIQTLDRCRVISRYGVGYDNVDLNAAEEAGIWVTNVPGYCTEEAAEHALGMLLSCVRAIPEKDRRIRGGEWNINRPIRRMSGRVLGIVGFGATGRAFWEKVQGFGFSRILIADPRGASKIETLQKKQEYRSYKAQAVSFEYLMGCSDFISFHVPLNESTRHCINKETLAGIKDGAIIVNISRGAIVDEAALIGALKTGKLSAAALDVFEREPLSRDNPLLSLPNVVLTDHSAYYSAESVSELKTRTALNAREVLEGRIPKTPVNRPRIREGTGPLGAEITA
ncbi:MAG: C-terminal binding protein [Spirochaetaceae bacterium]|jgi:D-3-phosphoglycerate dehydrogenase|nr:C-terminal binding protein [Spirochaetaceae bacterium]